MREEMAKALSIRMSGPDRMARRWWHMEEIAGRREEEKLVCRTKEREAQKCVSERMAAVQRHLQKVIGEE